MRSLLILSSLLGVIAYSAVPRWGQAVVIVEDALFIHGGKVDEFNEQYYTTSPNTNDLLYLSLSTGFQVSSPPWELVASSSNASTSQGPALSWHTISAVNTTTALLFGGQPGPNSPTVTTDSADSAFLLDLFENMHPNWLSQPQGWAAEPTRRIYHSTVTLPDGRVLIIGGTKADGSGLTFPKNWMFDITRLLFTILDLEDGPTDLYGHVSLILPDGRVVVFGGVLADSAIPLTTIWILDISGSTWSWSVITISSDSVPVGRRAFAAVVLPDGRILIHGGADKDIQTTFSDGWILDLFHDPPTWTRIPTLDQIGPRHDHFAVAYGPQVIFGFGYGPSTPAPADIQVYDVDHDDFPSIFTPPPPPYPSHTPTTHGTLPGTTPTGSRPPTNSHGPQPTIPTPKPDPPVGGGPDGDDSNKASSKTTAIAVGTAFGVLGLVAMAGGAFYYYRRRRREQEQRGLFSSLNGDDDESPQSPHGIHPAGGHQEKHGMVGGVLASIGLHGRGPSQPLERRDMLADEDTRQFGWSPYGSVIREASAGSSWSVKNLLAGVRGRTREPSSGQTSLLGTPWREKPDPFSDGAELMRDEETGFAGAAAVGAIGARPRGGRQASYTSNHSENNFVDPFSDLEHEKPDPPPLSTGFPAGEAGHTLSPLTEQDSRNSLSITSQSVSSLGQPPSNTSNATSYTNEASPRPSSIIDANPGGRPIRRSDSWWARFASTSLLARRHSDASQRSRPLDIRDPNPLPRLGAIEETGHSASSPDDSPQSAQKDAKSKRGSVSRKKSRYSTGMHAKSLSSVQTAQTANSEALERMAGMDVAQRMGSGSYRTRSSLGSSFTADSVVDDLLDIRHYESPVEISHDHPTLTTAVTNSAPYPTTHATSTSLPSKSSELSPHSKDSFSDRPPSESSVASRIAEFERRSSPRDETPSSPKKADNRSRKKSVTVGYGLVPKPSLFVANPDHATSPFED